MTPPPDPRASADATRGCACFSLTGDGVFVGLDLASRGDGSETVVRIRTGDTVQRMTYEEWLGSSRDAQERSRRKAEVFAAIYGGGSPRAVLPPASSAGARRRASLDGDLAGLEARVLASLQKK